MEPGETKAFLEELLADPNRHCFIRKPGSMDTACRACEKPFSLHRVKPGAVPHAAILQYVIDREAERRAEGGAA